MMPTLPDLDDIITGITSTLEEKENTAYTLTLLVQMGPVVDAHYVWSTAKAKRMFGRDLGSPGQEWQSYTLPRDVCYRSALAGISRIKMRDVTQTYITPIIHGRTKQEREVKKTVQLCREKGAILYLTKIEPLPVHVDCRHIRDIALNGAEEWDYDHVFMSEIQEMIGLGAFELVKQRDFAKMSVRTEKNPLTSNMEEHSINSMKIAIPKMTFEQNPILLDDDTLIYLGTGPGESFWIDDGTAGGSWNHGCKFCPKRWNSKQARPYRCANHDCFRAYWWRGAPDVLSHSERAKLAKNPGRKKRTTNK